jgi:hypothetical protein
MQADALRPLNSALDEDAMDKPPAVKDIFTPETVEEAAHFLRLNARFASRGQSSLLMYIFHRPGIDCGWCLHIFVKSIRIASGAELSTTTQRRWMNNVLARKKMHTINAPIFPSDAWSLSAPMKLQPEYGPLIRLLGVVSQFGTDTLIQI